MRRSAGRRIAGPSGLVGVQQRCRGRWKRWPQMAPSIDQWLVRASGPQPRRGGARKGLDHRAL